MPRKKFGVGTTLLYKYKGFTSFKCVLLSKQKSCSRKNREKKAKSGFLSCLRDCTGETWKVMVIWTDVPEDLFIKNFHEVFTILDNACVGDRSRFFEV